jgi:type III restriction enzyme
MSGNNPILNNPYEEPQLHYFTNLNGELNYENIENGRRPFDPNIYSIPHRQGDQQSALSIKEVQANYASEKINLKSEYRLGL